MITDHAKMICTKRGVPRMIATYASAMRFK